MLLNCGSRPRGCTVADGSPGRSLRRQGITGGEEDGVDNTGVDNASLYSQPEDIWDAVQALSKFGPAFTIAASFGNVHGVYKPGNVRRPPSCRRARAELPLACARRLQRPQTPLYRPP